MPRPLRASCDRCHSQKLRCPKESGIASCTRCLKAGARCAFSPAGPAVRRTATLPAASNSTDTVTAYMDDGNGGGDFTFPTTSYDDDGLGMLFDWQRVGFDGTDTGTGTGTGTLTSPPLAAAIRDAAPPPPTEPIQAEEAASALPSDPSPGSRRSTYVRQLTALAADVDTAYRGLPDASSFRAPKSQPVGNELVGYWEAFNPQPLFELLFSSAQALVDLYPAVLDIIFHNAAVPQQNHQPQSSDGDHFHDPDHVHASDSEAPWPGEESAAAAAAAAAADDLDIFLFNLLVLCHSRLLDVFGRLLSHAALCANTALAHPNGGKNPPRVSVPELRVGSFVAPASSSSTMQAVLLAHIASVLRTRSQQLSRKLSETLTGSGSGSDVSDKRSRMLRLQCEVLEESSADRVRQLQDVKDRLDDLEFPI